MKAVEFSASIAIFPGVVVSGPDEGILILMHTLFLLGPPLRFCQTGCRSQAGFGVVIVQCSSVTPGGTNGSVFIESGSETGPGMRP